MARADDGSAHVARERIEEALVTLAKLDGIRTAVGQLHKSAEKISSTADDVQTALNRLLLQAQAALVAGGSLASVPQAHGEPAAEVA